MVGRDYMLKKPSGPSAPKLFFDTRIVPLATNAVGDLEVLLNRSAVRTGLRSSFILAGIGGLASLVLLRIWSRSSAAGRRS